jgi:hypothetical protein
MQQWMAERVSYTFLNRILQGDELSRLCGAIKRFRCDGQRGLQ